MTLLERLERLVRRLRGPSVPRKPVVPHRRPVAERLLDAEEEADARMAALDWRFREYLREQALERRRYQRE